MINRIVLLFLISISFLGKNKPLFIGGIIVFILSFLNKGSLLKLNKDIFLNIGLTFLMIWILLPIIQTEEQMSLFNMKGLLNMEGLISLLTGLFVVVIATKGLKLLDNNPSVLTGALIGSIIGVTFFGGIPVGMLSGSGIAYLILKLIKWIR